MSRKMKVLVAVLLAVTGIVAVIHKNSQKDIPCMVIRQGDQEISVDFSDLDRMEFSGELVDGKGTVTSHTYRGVRMKDLLSTKGMELSDITVTSVDNYTVKFIRGEIQQENKVYVAVTVDGEPIEGIDPGTAGVQIIVFGDPNSRRCVRYASIIEMIPKT